jgi:hypothetical protein
MIDKIEERLARLETNRLKAKGREHIRAHIWSRVEERFKELPSIDHDIIDRGFVFGDPLNDTVFMLAPISSAGGDIEQHEFDVKAATPGLEKFDIDFFVRLGGREG